MLGLLSPWKTVSFNVKRKIPLKFAEVPFFFSPESISSILFFFNFYLCIWPGFAGSAVQFEDSIIYKVHSQDENDKNDHLSTPSKVNHDLVRWRHSDQSVTGRLSVGVWVYVSRKSPFVNELGIEFASLSRAISPLKFLELLL